MSLKCMIDKWLHKGQISQEEYDAVIKKLEGHDKQIREEVIEEVKQTLLESLPLVNNHDLITGFCCAIERVEQMQKGAENDRED